MKRSGFSLSDFVTEERHNCLLHYELINLGQNESKCAKNVEVKRKLLCKKTQIFCMNSIGRARKSEVQLTNKSTFSVHECLNCVSCFERVWCAAAAVKMQSNAMFAERRTHMYSHDEMMGYQWLQCIV